MFDGQTIPDATGYTQQLMCLTEDEYLAIVKAMDVPTIQMATNTLWYTGLRMSELCYLTISDVDLSHNIMHAPRKWDPGRDIPIHPTLHLLLEQYQTEHRLETEPTERFFVFGERELSPSRYKHFLQRAVKRLGLQKRVIPVNFRLTFATNLIKRGVPPMIVMKLLGWHHPSEDTDVPSSIEWDRMSDAIKLL